MGKRGRNLDVKVRFKDLDDLDEDYEIFDEDEEEEEEEYEEVVDFSEFDDDCDFKEYDEGFFDGCDVFEVVEDEGFNEVEEEEEDVMLRNVEWLKVKIGFCGNRKIMGCKLWKVDEVVVFDNEDVDLDDEEDEEMGELRKGVKVGCLDGIGLGK